MEKDLLINDPLLVLGQMVIMIGLMVGGLIVADKMGISFAKAALGAAQGGGKAFGAWAGGRAKQYGTAPLRGKTLERRGRQENQIVWGKIRGMGE